MEQTLSEFKIAQKTKNPRRKDKITNSWGVYDYFKYYRTHRPNKHEYVLYECVYFEIIRKVNKLLVEKLCEEGSLEFPFRMGKLITRKSTPKTYIEDGKAHTTKRVNWDKTLELWYNDKEAYNNKTLIYHENKETCFVQYDKLNAIFKNKGYYGFAPGRDVKNKVREAFKSGKIAPASVFGRKEINQIKGLYDE